MRGAKSLKGKIDKSASGASLEFKIDVYRIDPSTAQTRRRWIDLQHTMRRCHYRVVHDDIPTRFQNLDIRDLPAGLNPNLQSANEGF
jgi:hypothetical protein